MCGAMTTCCLCGAEDFETVALRDRLGGPLRTVICRGCGLVSHAEIPTAEALSRYYQANYRQEYHGQSQPSDYRLVREWERGRRLAQHLAPYLKPRSSVFEIGAGLGCNLKHFQLMGHTAAGIEPGRSFCEYSQLYLRVDLRCQRWEELAQRDDGAEHDLVLLVHVLEHFRDPLDALAQCRRLLRPNGLLFIEVPNLAAPHASPDRLFHTAHIYNFTPITLERVCRAAGFDVVMRTTSPGSRNLGYLAQRLESPTWTGPFDGGYEEALRAIRRFTPFGYYARPDYLWHRARTVAHRLRGRFTAKRHAMQILRLCQAEHDNRVTGSRTAAA
jgi:2-polyprenyl-3-methyl-5-hydroxy-6-metoxy-1,4-benzoquinol methylase